MSDYGLHMRFEELSREYLRLEEKYAELMREYLDLERYCEQLEQGNSNEERSTK